MKIIKSFVKTICFIAIFALIFSYLSNLLCRKTLFGTWNHTQKISGFFNEPENEFDIIFFGSSNTYCSFNPLILYEETGIKSYVLATQQQPVWASYAYIKEALKTQSPKLLVLDILMFSKADKYYDDGVNYSFMDDIPFSKNKIELAFASTPAGERLALLFNFIKYHSRWSELTEGDYKFHRNKTNDYLKGYVLLEETFANAQPPEYNTEEIAPLADKEIFYFNKIVSLAKEKNIPLLLVKTPSNVTSDDQKLFNSVKKLAKENNVVLTDYNTMYPEIGLVMNEDFYDTSHLNYKGAEKYTKYFAKNLKMTPSTDMNNTSEEWAKNVYRYHEYCAGIKNE